MASAALTGTITASATEAQIRTGGKTIILTLTADTWVAGGATFNAQRQAIINGIDSAQAESTGWDAVVKAGMNVEDVVRTSPTVVTITLEAFPTYSITAQETITAIIPAAALTGASPITASPTFTVDVVKAVALTGTATAGITEANIVAGGKTIILTLHGDTWVTAGANFDAQRQNIINGIDSDRAEAAGWDAVVKATAAVTDVVRTSNTVCTVTLEAFATFNITGVETVTATVPATAVAGGGALVAPQTFSISQVKTATQIAAFNLLGVG